MTTEPPRKDLERRIESFVEWLFADFSPRVARGPKVINDALLGNQYFARHEVAVIDSPLLQRLKQIKQTGLVFQVFPSARHSRFEHSLGAATLAERCLTAIGDRASLEGEPSIAIPTRDRGDLAELRMAALLHDVGHGLCSHLSEQIYEAFTDIRAFEKDPDFVDKSPGEILSYLIVQTRAFRDWFQGVQDECSSKLDVDTVASMILGRHPDPQKLFLAQIVSSPYDADKLDYIARDSLNCGLALTVDLPRFYSMIATTTYNQYKVLVLRNYVPLEQILFSKMTLFGSVYHHHKVKCLDQMMRAMLMHIAGNAATCAFQTRGRAVAFQHAVDFLYVTDDEFFGGQAFGDDVVKGFHDRFRRRDLLARCVEISRRTVENWPSPERKNLIDLSAKPAAAVELERAIYERLPRSQRSAVHPSEVLFSVPKPPKLKGGFAFIQTDQHAAPEPIEQYFPLEQWTDSYSHSKWKSFVYAPASVRPLVRDAAIDVIAERLGLKVDKDRSNQACHVA